MSDEGLRQWTDESTDTRNKEFRQSVHTVLRALSSIPHTSEWIALKGAVLLSLRYRFTRFTRDIDFSTQRRYEMFDTGAFLTELSTALIRTADELPYGLACKIQSHEVRPSRSGANYQTLHIRIGYAPKLDSARLRRLMSADGSPTLITMDLSFNEPLCELEMLDGNDSTSIPVYSLTDFVAEKYRAILQQPVRNRIRPQDSLDIYMLLDREELHELNARNRVLDALLAKSNARELIVDSTSMRNSEVREQSARDYPSLANQIEIALPAFDTVFDAVTKYYEALPW